MSLVRFDHSYSRLLLVKLSVVQLVLLDFVNKSFVTVDHDSFVLR